MNLNLKDKTALVFGASQGLGKAVALSLITEGAQVAICSRNEQKLMTTQKEIGAATYFVGDMTQPLAAKKVTEATLKHFGKIDILVTNTGGPAKGDFLEVTLEQWQKDFQALWLSVVESLQVTLPQMKLNHFGRVLMLTSVAAEKPLRGLTTSNGLRAGLKGLAKSLALEYSKDNITFNLLQPGYTSTDRLRNLKLSEDAIRDLTPAERLGTPSELANLATYLASEQAGYITGQAICIDGAVSFS